MRKYFLISAVALLSIGTANATTDYAEVTAKATIEVANEVDCGEVNWGTIVVKQNNSDILLQMNPYTGEVTSGSDDVISVTDSDSAVCSTMDGNFDWDGISELPSVTLRAEGEIQTLTYVPVGDMTSLAGKLTIPANVKAGTYTGSFTVSVTY
ncbi:MAG: hypothetical protein E7016_03540 [Alphaproteobacteria bacterium]|nr:hypothetical protein [Alphaproteobacteria bacterium]